MTQNQPIMEKEWFEENLKTLMQSLYNPVVLRGSPLAALIGSYRRGDPVTVLRDTLLEGIEALRPGHSTPRDSRTWRIYTILRRRFVEQVGQEIVARDMGLSVRQLQREEKVARQVLADHLWVQNGLDEKVEQVGVLMEKREPPAQPPDANARSREMEWLRETAEYKDTSLDLMFQEVLRTAAPILRIHQVEVEYAPVGYGTENGRRVLLPAALVRQALLNVLAALSKTFPSGRVRISCMLSAADLRIVIHCTPVESARLGCSRDLLLKEYEDAVSLLGILGGSISVEEGAGAKGCDTLLTVPLLRQAPILVIDDNADSLLLVERYLAGSPYRFIGVRDSREAVRAAEEIAPDAIIMDVMMPDRDGWDLLGQFREHPATQHIPVVICSILSQRDLAIALGAADFLRKPVTRQALLAAMDRLWASR